MGSWKSSDPFTGRIDLSPVDEACSEKARTQILEKGTNGLFWIPDPAVPVDSYDLGFSDV